MKQIKPIVLLLLTAFSCNLIQAQADKEAMMKAWTAYMTPGEVHKMMAKSDGEWNADISMWMDPTAKPMTSKGTGSIKMILGGRYQESSYKADVMGMKMEGVGTMGYDNAKKIFQSTWVDNLGTGIMTMTGSWDDATKTINLTGMQTDPTTGKDMPVRETLQFPDDKHQVMTMYMTPEGGSEFKTTEIKFTKK